MVAVGVRNEYLSEALTTHQFHYLLNPFGIQLVEDIVEKEQRCRAGSDTAQEVELRKLQGYEKSLTLPLRTFAANRIPPCNISRSSL